MSYDPASTLSRVSKLPCDVLIVFFLVDGVAQVADLWQARGPANAASRILCLLPPSSFPITSVYTLPPGLKSFPLFSAVMIAAGNSLLATYGDALAVITTPVLLEQLNLLPQPAVLALLQSDKVVTDAEASVLLLVCGWAMNPVGHACSEEEKEELNNHIRYSRLSPPYLTDLCAYNTLPSLTSRQLQELWAFSGLKDETEWDAGNAADPVQWYLPRRRKTTPTKV